MGIVDIPIGNGSVRWGWLAGDEAMTNNFIYVYKRNLLALAFGENVERTDRTVARPPPVLYSQNRPGCFQGQGSDIDQLLLFSPV